MRRTFTHVAVVALVLVITGACSGSGSGSEGADAPDAATGRASLSMPAGTSDAEVAATLGVIRRRLHRFGVSATVRAVRGAVTVDPDPGPFVLEALAQRDPTRIASVERTTPGPCSNGGVPSVRPRYRCSTVAATSVGTGAVAATSVRSTELDGYGVDVTIADARWPAWRDGLAARREAPAAIVAGDRVLAAVSLSTPALQTRISGQLTRADARRIAAALLVDTSLPVTLGAPRTPVVDGPDGHDVWNTSLVVRVCGRTLGPAPSFTTEEGVHSHGDGYVYVHSLRPGDLGRRPRLGDFLRLGGWTMTADRIELWDRARHDAGHPCPGTADSVVRWTVDGGPRAGSPSALRLGPGQVVVVEFGPADGPVAAAPADAGLLTTRWSPAPAG